MTTHQTQIAGNRENSPIPTFGAWLLGRAEDGTPVGDLASDFVTSNVAAQDMSILDVVLQLRKLGACSQAWEAFRDAEIEYEKLTGGLSR